jgi:acyl-CoA reductase-like NAD-dependent aldehyde dehydrogenase
MDQDLASIAEARSLLERTRKAFERFKTFDQARIDRITYAAVEAGYGAAERLARLAVEETGIGHVPGKTAKNRFSTRGLWAAIRGLKTCGIVSEDADSGVLEVADPFGVVAAIIPTTNPTSTALFKAIICLKSRNGMVASPHPRSVRCVSESIKVVMEAAASAGAPTDILTCMTTISLEGTQALMRHDSCDLILATGGSALVHEAYSSGKPAFGVGPGNVPAYVDRSADAAYAARCLVESQTFDNGTICSSEQAIVCDRPIADRLVAELRARKCHFCSPEEVKRLEAIVMRGKLMNPDIVGLAAPRVARAAGFSVPEDTTVLIAPYEGVGREHPLSHEKLCPLLVMYVVDGWEAGCRKCIEVLRYGGLGHTLGLHCEDEAVIRAFAIEKPVNRIVVNSPTSQGAVGFTTRLFPSMTLGCGSFGGNITSDNIGPQHLLNIKRVGRVRPEYRDGRMTDEFPHLPPDGEGRPAASPWSEQRETRESSVPEPAQQAPRLANPARIPFSREEVRGIIATRLKERKRDNAP